MKKFKSFEEAMQRLEQISGLLEEQTLELDKSLALYQEAAEIVKFCSDKLNTAKLQVEQITFDKIEEKE